MLRVIIVEDEDIIRRGLVCTVDWLSMDAMVVGDAPDGEAGLALLDKERPDVVLTDIRMPRLDGIAMIERAREKGIAPAVIFLTSYEEFAYAKKAVQLQAIDYLLKPVDEEELQRTLALVAAQRQPTEAAAAPQSKRPELVDWGVWLGVDSLNPYVRRAIEHIREQYREKTSIEALAVSYGVSASYLSRKFKEETSQTFGELLTKYRLQKAMQILSEGTCRVYEAAEQSGFGDYKNFCTVFKKYMHVSPKEFMNRATSIIHREDTNDKKL